MLAAGLEDTSMMKTLIQAKADQTATDPTGRTAIDIATAAQEEVARRYAADAERKRCQAAFYATMAAQQEAKRSAAAAAALAADHGTSNGGGGCGGGGCGGGGCGGCGG